MKTIGFVVPYFTCGNGTVHPMTQLWLDSCKYNSTVDWLFFTDCDLSSFDVPANVQIIKSSFEEIKAKIQSLFGFKISLNKPYKLCDFKPVYGEAFAEELQKYDFWGFCDIDLIWGDIRKFITDEILEKYDRVLTHGHCSIFRNCPIVNSGYRTLDPKGCMDWRSVFSSDKLYAFDEWALHNGGGYAEIQKRNNVAMYDVPIFADIQINRFSLHTTLEQNSETMKRVHNRLFYVHSGKLEDYVLSGKKLSSTEYLYAHFQQRKLDVESGLNRDNYLIVPPNKAVNWNGLTLTSSKVKKFTTGNILSWNVKGQLKRIVYLVYKRINTLVGLKN